MNITHHKNGEIKTLVDEAPYHPGYEDVGFKSSPVKLRSNELADWIEKSAYGEYETAKQAATMLRAQQAEIEALKNILEQEGIGVGRDLLNGGIALFRKAQEK